MQNSLMIKCHEMNASRTCYLKQSDK